MNWFRCTGGNSGGGGGSGDVELFDVVIDWAMYSYPEQLYDIPLPANYTNYDKLAITIIQASYATDQVAYSLNCLLSYLLENGSLNNTFAIIDTSNITSSVQNIDIPMLNPLASFSFGTWGNSRINTEKIKGYNYSWGWNDFRLIAFGIHNG